MSKIIPPDRNQCQSEIKEGSFMTFGPRSFIRCKNVPAYIAKENKPGSDGKKGSMSLCEDCSKVFLDKFGKVFATLKPIQKKKKKEKGK